MNRIACRIIIWMAKLTLDEALKKKKMSKRQFAKKLGVLYSNVFRMFRPSYDPKFSTLVEIAKVLDVKVKDLYEE
jgi:transcriptional regulator with XRE-family HTH domain